MSLTRITLILGIPVAILTIASTALDLPAKWKAWREPSDGNETHGTTDLQPLNGEILDATTHEPLRGVTVVLPEQGLSTVTDDFGTFGFQVAVASEARVKLRARLAGYRTLDLDPIVGPGQSTWLMRRE